MKKILSLSTLLAIIYALVGGVAGSAANRYATNSFTQLKPIISQVAMAAVGAGGFVFLQEKKGTAFEILKFVALAFSFQSVNSMLSTMGEKLSASQQAAIADGTAKPLTNHFLKALTTTAPSAGMGNAQIFLKKISGGGNYPEYSEKRVAFAS